LNVPAALPRYIAGTEFMTEFCPVGSAIDVPHPAMTRAATDAV
jgi:hypothetical protein